MNRARAMQLDAGGKGVNVASFLADYGLDVAATGFLGRENAGIFEEFFARKRIDDQFVRIPGRTRIGVKIVDEASHQTTDINMPGLSPSADAAEALVGTIDRLIPSCDWFVLAGTLPPGVPATLYAAIIAGLKRHGKRVALDTSGDALREGVAAGPTIVKPNVDELQQLMGRSLGDEVALEQAARQLLEEGMAEGIALVVVSMGERGALFVDRRESLVAVPPTVAVMSTVGAGDAMVAGLIAGHAQGLALAECARLTTAFAVGAVTRVGAHLPARETLQAYVDRVLIRAPAGRGRPAQAAPASEGRAGIARII